VRAWGLALACGLLTAAPLAADDGEPAPKALDRGLEIGFRLSALSVFNASPLAYSPLDLGWRFGNGLRARTGVSLFYYEGADSNKALPDQGVQRYSYEMVNWRSSLEYVVPLPLALRPVAGLSVDLISGTRHLVGVPLAPRIGAWSVLAPGALLGLDYRGGPHWALGLQARYSHGFSETGSVVAADLGWRYLF
jgi:hypothetical protein